MLRKVSHTSPCSASGIFSCNICAVRGVAMCADLTPENHEKLEQIMQHRFLADGETLYHEGDERRYVYSVTNGAMRLLKTLPDGRRFIAGFLLPGDFIGLTDGDKHNLTAEAIKDCELCVFEREELEKFMVNNHEIKDRILAMTKCALRVAHESQLILGRFSPVEKIARFILDMNDRINGLDQEKKIVVLPMNRTDIADYLGLTIETVSRSFSKLKAQGLIRLANSTIVTILNKDELSRIAAKI